VKSGWEPSTTVRGEIDEEARTRAGLGRLGARYGLSRRQRSQLATLLAALAADDHAPTAVRRTADALDIHLADSLVALELQPTHAAGRIADLGSGAGFPGLVLAVALPDAEVRLVESQRRRCEFLERICAEARIANARVVRTRAEEWREGIGEQDLVLARALAAQRVVLEYAAPLLRMRGMLIDWRGRRDLLEEAGCAAVADELGLERAEIRHMTPFEGAREHNLHLYLKVRQTPARFPRRAGIARKNPLSA
jgi:16S rRNA (guanine527-N7)-methyltransferase